MYERKVLLGFIRAHILHHADSEKGIYGAWMMEELKGHGYELSPGTLYPILHEMVKDGALTSSEKVVNGKVRKIYHITEEGKRTLSDLKTKIRELSGEVLV